MARVPDSLGLISLLEDLRDAYELAKETQHEALQTRLMDARRTLVGLLKQNLDLHAEILDLQEHVRKLRQEDRTFEARDQDLLVAASRLARGTRKVS